VTHDNTQEEHPIAVFMSAARSA